jgi:hypothetical protein
MVLLDLLVLLALDFAGTKIQKFKNSGLKYEELRY